MDAVLDKNFADLLACHPGGENVRDCFLCGTCTACCPVSEIDSDYNPRKIMRQILYGMKNETLSDGEIWKCYQCHNCVSHCPQDVRFADIVRALREISVSEGFYDSDFEDKVKELDFRARTYRLEQVNLLLEGH